MPENQYLLQATSHCSRQEVCISEISEKLIKWGCPNNETENIVEQLIAQNYINELRYATAYTRDKLRFNHWGFVKIKYMLKAKQISNLTINKAFAEIDNILYSEILLNELKKKQKTLGADYNYDMKQKLIKYALSKGFEYSDIEKAINIV